MVPIKDKKDITTVTTAIMPFLETDLRANFKAVFAAFAFSSSLVTRCLNAIYQPSVKPAFLPIPSRILR